MCALILFNCFETVLMDLENPFSGSNYETISDAINHYSQYFDTLVFFFPIYLLGQEGVK